MSIAMTTPSEATTATEQPVGNQVFNVPNQITMARFVLAIVVFVLIPLELYLAALIIFVLAAATDWVDGYWARKFGQVTQLGRMLDPFVDKIIICGTSVFLASQAHLGSLIFAWMAVVVVGRELLVTALRSTLEQQGRDFSANMPGKLKMVFQCGAVVCSLLVLMHTASEPAMWLTVTTHVWVYLAVLSTIYSGVIYVFAAIRMMTEQPA